MTKRTFQPRGKLVLVERDSEESRVSEHGLSTPDSVEQEKKSIGTVVAVGPDIKDLKKGDRVVFGTFAGDPMPLEEGSKKVDYIFLHDEEILSHVDE